MKKNIDKKTVQSFGDEWAHFDQSGMNDTESLKIFKDYFDIFPWHKLPDNAEGFDMGCGSGRWANFVAPKINHLHCIDPSKAIDVARKNLHTFNNVSFHHGSLDDGILNEKSQDFGYSLGVLHHVPDTEKAILSCAKLLKPGAPLLLYLYYAFDNRPLWYKLLWKLSDFLRKIIFHLPSPLKVLATNIIAAIIYFPLARLSNMLENFNFSISSIPLSYYRNCSFYTMKTDARDRFGTPLEQRFSRSRIAEMMEKAGLESIEFSNNAPYWCALGYAKSDVKN